MNIQKGDFVELEFTGRSNGVVFDTNNPSELKKMGKGAKEKKMILIVGQGMVVKGLDNALDGKEIEKEYSVKISYNDGFGARSGSLVKTIPLHVFAAHKINPRAGMSFVIDNMLVKVINVSGSRVVADFNHPLAGKELDYEFKILRKIDDVNEKTRAFFESLLGLAPEFETINEKVIIKGKKELELIINSIKGKFKELVGLELGFALKQEDKENK